MVRKRATILLVIGVTAGLLGCVLMFLDIPIPYLVLVCLFITAFVCNALGFVYAIKNMRYDARNK